MDVEWLRRVCLALPQATETVQWGDNLVFKVAGKMFAVMSLEPSGIWLSFKTTPQRFDELTERSGFLPAPYLARAKWVAVERPGATSAQELQEFLTASYHLVVETLPKKTRLSLVSMR